MTRPEKTYSDFLSTITSRIEDNLSDENFGVSELARSINMSRSNLLRKVKSLSGISVSQFIREVRLKAALELMKDQELTVSEISYKVGFNTPSYFIKCFHDYYGYTPGEAIKASAQAGTDGKGYRNHRLAAIMFTDIQGYTALMQQDEEQALLFIKRHREVFNGLTSKYGGRILQYYGDGTLSTFGSAIDAVNCGIEMQLEFKRGPKIPVRVGIHSGDVIFSNQGVIGDGVNVASRIESLAIPESVFISEKVYDEVKNQSSIHTVSLGQFQFKNVRKPIEVYAVTNYGLAVPQREELSGKVTNEVKLKRGQKGKRSVPQGIQWALLPIAIMILGFLIYNSLMQNPKEDSLVSDSFDISKSIAVLPFINDSNDSGNIYIVNGLMDAILNNLQKIEDLRVISRTSVEKYRNSSKLIPEIASDLNVKYLVEGSGQKIGDRISLNVQLIEAISDRHLWSQRFERETKDIFNIQIEVARNIADAIQVIIKPQEEQQLNKVPTENAEAYDYFLKGQHEIFKGTKEGILQSIPLFRKAINADTEFAYAYADMAIAFFFLDAFQSEKMYLDSISYYADKAILYDKELPQSLMAKALYFLNAKDYKSALPYMETAHEYHPNSAMVLNFLSDFYARFVPNTGKYLEYALKGARLDIGSQDSTTASFTMLHISNALAQNGFITESMEYIMRSLDFDPGNLYAEYLKAFIIYAEERDLKQLQRNLTFTFQKDSTRLDIMQEVAKACYYQRDYPMAYKYYSRFLEIKESNNLDIFPGENAKIALVFSKIGLEEQAEKYMEQHKNFAESDQSVYKPVSEAVYYSYRGDDILAIEKLRSFAQEEDFQYWYLIFLPIDPLFDNIQDHPEFDSLMEQIEAKFWKRHDELKKQLLESGVI